MFPAPALFTDMVYVPFVPTTKRAGPDLVIRRSKSFTGVTSEVELLPVAAKGSPPPAMVAVFVTLGTAALVTATVKVTLLDVPPAVIATLFVQLIFELPTVLLPAPPWFAAQIHPAPGTGIAASVIPLGRVSVSV